MGHASTIFRLAISHRENHAFALLVHGDPPARLAQVQEKIPPRQENTGNRNALRSSLENPACSHVMGAERN